MLTSGYIRLHRGIGRCRATEGYIGILENLRGSCQAKELRCKATSTTIIAHPAVVPGSAKLSKHQAETFVTRRPSHGLYEGMTQTGSRASGSM